MKVLPFKVEADWQRSISMLESQAEPVAEFSERLWGAMVDYVTVGVDKRHDGSVPGWAGSEWVTSVACMSAPPFFVGFPYGQFFTHYLWYNHLTR